MNQKGFGLIIVVITVAIIAVIAGTRIYKGKQDNKKSLIEVGLDATVEAEKMKNALEERQRMLQGFASTSLESELDVNL